MSCNNNKTLRNVLQPHETKVYRFFQPPKGDNLRPYHIRNAIKKLDKSADKPETGLVHLLLKNPSGRVIDQSRLEACITVAQTLVYFTDFETGYVGKFCKKTGEFKHMSIGSIAYYAGIGLRRTKRALEDLTITFYFESKKRVRRLSEMMFKSYTSIKKLTAKFFYHLGIKEKTLKKIKRFKEQQRAEIQSKQSFHVQDAQFVQRNVFDHKGHHVKNYTEKIPRSIMQIILKRFAF